MYRGRIFKSDGTSKAGLAMLEAMMRDNKVEQRGSMDDAAIHRTIDRAH